MSSQMHSKIVDSWKWFVANFTSKLFLLVCAWIAACVNEVPLEMVLARERFVARRAFAWTFRDRSIIFLAYALFVRLTRLLGWFLLLVLLDHHRIIIFRFNWFRFRLRLLDSDCVSLSGTLMLCVFLKYCNVKLWISFDGRDHLTSLVSKLERQALHNNNGVSSTDTAKTSVGSFLSSFVADLRFLGDGDSTLATAALFFDPFGLPITQFLQSTIMSN